MALNCFWAFLFSRFADQAYMSLVIILEALLSTGTAGITHQLSERAATLIGQSSRNRCDIRKAIRKLYKLRSQITHGDLELKKGPIKWDKTVITATMTIVSIPMLTDMARYSVAVVAFGAKQTLGSGLAGKVRGRAPPRQTRCLPIV